jgi:hypothetical protein
VQTELKKDVGARDCEAREGAVLCLLLISDGVLKPLVDQVHTEWAQDGSGTKTEAGR